MSGGPEKPRGRFITLEGGEGAGKSTQAARLAAYLQGLGRQVTLTREPGGAPGAEDIRRLLVEGEPGRWTPKTEALLHNAARADHVARVIAPALASGAWVVCDRYSDSTAAYQGHGHGLDPEWVAKVNACGEDGVRPDLTLILDLPVDTGLSRARARAGGEDRYERMDRSFHDRLRAGFLAIAAAEPERCVVLDATGTEDEVQALIRKTIDQRLGAAA